MSNARKTTIIVTAIVVGLAVLLHFSGRPMMMSLHHLMHSMR